MVTPSSTSSGPGAARGADTPEVLALFEGELELVEVVGRQVARSIGGAVELDDLRSFGREGLLDAARRFDSERGVPFRAYANFRVRGAMIDGVRAMSQLPRRAHERLNGLSAALRASEGAADDTFTASAGGARAQADQALGEHLAGMATALAMGLIAPTGVGEAGEQVQVTTADSPEDAVLRAQLLHSVKEAIEELPEDEANLVRRHYLEGERFDQVARSLGLSKSWASRLHTRAMQKLAKRFREKQ
ncbi:MAG: sigma-70 family RNA polymerase sigma factor [Myxococcales bacterium]|nr:MAG: sigma-70 family RNA polymerase sigma factor [Myxococcales bacterium]